MGDVIQFRPREHLPGWGIDPPPVEPETPDWLVERLELEVKGTVVRRALLLGGYNPDTITREEFGSIPEDEWQGLKQRLHAYDYGT